MLERLYQFLSGRVAFLERELYEHARAVGDNPVRAPLGVVVKHVAAGVRYLGYGLVFFIVKFFVLIGKSPVEGYRLMAEPAQTLSYIEYRKLHVRTRRFSFATGGVLVAAVVIVSLVLNLVVPAALPSLGATYTFNQTNWSGGATANNATHPTNQSSWNQYSSKSAEITTAASGADLVIASTTASVLKTSDTDFSGGTFTTATTTGSGSGASIRLTKAAHVNEYTIGALANIAVTATTVTTNTNGTWTIAFSGTPNLARIFKNDKFTDSAGKAWKVLSSFDAVDKIIVVDSEANDTAPATGSGTVGRWYASISAWEAGRQGDLVSRNAIERGLPYYDGSADTTTVTIDGWTTDATHYIEIYVPLSERHRGKWDSNKYRLSVNTTVRVLHIRESYVRIDGLQIETTGADTTVDAIDFSTGSAPSAEIYMSNSIVKNSIPGNTLTGIAINSSTNLTARIWNNIVYDFSDGYGFWTDSSTAYLYNNTFFNNQNGIFRLGGVVIAKNNIAYNNTDNYSGSFSVASANNLSGPSQTDAPGSNPVNAATVQFVDTASGDFHLLFSDTAAKNAGTDLSGDANLAFSTDMDGDTRSGAWDIGADDVGSVLVKVHSIGTNGRDFSTLQAWEDARDGVLTTRRVFKIASQSAAFTAGETITGGTSGATGVYIKERDTPSASETYMSLDSVTGTFQAAETLTGGTSGSTATLSTVLTTGGVVEKGEAYNDSVFTGAIQINGSTVDSSHYMWLIAEPGSRHDGNSYTAQGARVEAPVSSTPGIRADDNYSRVSWMSVKSVADSQNGLFLAGSNTLGEYIMSYAGSGYSGTRRGLFGQNNAEFRNSIVYGPGWSVGMSGATGVVANNVTVYGAGATGFNSGTLVKNSIAMGNSPDFGTMDGASSNNISSDGTAPGSGSLTSQTAATVKFVSTATGIEDFHIMNGSVAKDAGTNLSSAFATDIDGQTRSGTWDIGADEWQSSSPVYNTSGTYESPTIDFNNTVDVTTLSWSPTSQVTNTTLQFRVATSSDGSTWPGPYVGSDGTSATYLTTSGQELPSVLDGARYARFRGYLSSSDVAFSPRIDDVTLAYFQYATTSPSLISSAYNSADATNIFGKIAWSATTPAGTEMRMQVRSAPDSAGSPGTWSSWCGETVCDDADYFAAADNNIDLASNHPLRNGGNDQWLQYKAIFVSGGAYTPTLSDVTLTYVVNAPPDFDGTYGTNGVSVSQNTSDGQVVINYRARDTDTATGTVTPGYVTPTFAYSTDGGTNWSPITSGYLAAGDLSNKAVQAASYTTYSATWNAKGQVNGTYNASMLVRVTLSDNEGANNTASAISGTFALDVKNPSATVTVNGTLSGQANAITITSSDDSSYQMMASNNSDFSADGLNGTSGQWVAAASSLTWTFAAGNPVRVYIKFKDSYQNETSLSPDAPNTPANVTIQDTSSLALSEFREFVSWDVSAAGDFGSYKVYRSTDGSSYSLINTITDVNTNFMTDGSSGAWLSNGTTYYYKVTAQDASGNISRYSSVVSDIPDGQGGTDVTPPTITSVAVSGISTSQATATWTTDELSDSRVSYSTDTSYASSASSASMVTSHSVTLTGLTPNTAYNIRIRSIDPLSNSAQVDAASPGSNPVGNFSFTTAQGTVISSVTAVTVSGNSATIVWNTSSDSDSYVVYSSNSDLSGSQTTGSATLVGGAGPVYEHRVVLTGLSTNVRYYYKVRSTDGSGNLAEDTNGGQYYTFTTVNDVTPPVISNVNAALASQTSAAISWLTNELADSQVLYGTTAGNLTQQTSVNATMTINHSVVLSDLTAGTTYYYRVVSADPQSNSTTSSEYSFSTTAQELIAVVRYVEANPVLVDASAPLITGVQVSEVTDASFAVSWDTDENASSFVEYGRTEAFGTTIGQYGSARRHKVTVTNVLPSTLYYFRAKSHDASGNLAESARAQVTTKARETVVDAVAQKAEELKDVATLTTQVEQLLADLAGKVAPPQISGVDPKVSVTSSFAEIVWVTDRKANSIVAYAAEKDFLPSADESYRAFAGNAYEDVIEHKVVLSNLLPGTLYHFQVRSKGVIGGIGKSADMTFRTRDEAVISELQIRDIAQDSVTIAWKTNIQTTTRVEYGLSTEYARSQSDNSYNTAHVLTLKGLAPATFYHFRAGGLDRQGSQFFSPDLTFTTASPPSLLDVKIDAVKEREMTIRWFTNVVSDSAVEYTNTVSGKTEIVSDDQLVKNHAVTVTGLAQDTPYTFKVISRDEKGNEVASSLYNLQTLKDIEQPFISNIQHQSAISGKDRVQTIISWKTSEPATTRVYYQEGVAPNPALERSTQLDSELTLGHTVVFTTFKPGTAYRLRVESIDESGNVGMSRDVTILTPQQRETVFDLLIKNFQDIFKWTEKVF